MEPLSAISLAGNVLQFLQFTGSLLSESREIYHSISGTTTEFESLEEMSEYVARLSGRLVPAESPERLDTRPKNEKPIAAEIDLAHLALRCKEAANKLHTDLKASHVPSKSRGKLSALRQAFKNYLGKQRVRDMQKMVDSYREDLVFCLIAVTNEKQSTVVKYLDELTHANLTLVHDHAEKLKQISEGIENINSTANKLLRAEDKEVLLTSLSSGLADVGASSNRHWLEENAVVESLFYESLTVRHESIPDAHRDTFEWLLHPQDKRDKRRDYPNTSLRTWLRQGSGIYWISGKPGSGKSTLMKFIADHPEAQAALDDWSGSEECISTAYYFWSAGTRLQKSTEGLLRSLLFDIFVRNPALIQAGVPERWEKMKARDQRGRYDILDSKVQHSWTVSEMLSALERLSASTSITKRFCLFIDGLDEYHGDHQDIVKILTSLSSGRNFKLCVSSRPWNIFEDALGLDPSKKLYLHELTKYDIQQYTNSTLREDRNWRMQAAVDPRYNNLTDEITDRAQGVFLWVVLVVRSVLEGLSNGDSIGLLQKRMRDIPRELGPFFKHILLSIEPIYHRQMALYFQIALDAPCVLHLMSYWFLDQCFESDPSPFDQNPFEFTLQPMDSHDIFLRHSSMRRRLNARCKGLLESRVQASESAAHLGHHVTFLHRTVRDFLRTAEMSHFLGEILGDHTVNVTMLMAYISFIKSLPTNASVQPLLDHALTYARGAERESSETAIACLDELRLTLIDEDRMYANASDVSRLAVINGLCHYVSESMKVGVTGFEDPDQLFRVALRHSVSAPDQADMTEMIDLLLEQGARLSVQEWTDYLVHLGQFLGDHPPFELVSRQKALLSRLLQLAHNVNTTNSDGVAWAGVCDAIILSNWVSAPRKVLNTRFEILQLLFAHGANPNAPRGSTTVWASFCDLISAQPSSFAQDTVRAAFWGKIVEVLIKSGADLEAPWSLTFAQVDAMFQSRSARPIKESMQQQKLLSKNQSISNQPTAGWMLSWLLRRKA